MPAPNPTAPAESIRSANTKSDDPKSSETRPPHSCHPASADKSARAYKSDGTPQNYTRNPAHTSAQAPAPRWPRDIFSGAPAKSLERSARSNSQSSYPPENRGATHRSISVLAPHPRTPQAPPPHTL